MIVGKINRHTGIHCVSHRQTIRLRKIEKRRNRRPQHEQSETKYVKRARKKRNRIRKSDTK